METIQTITLTATNFKIPATIHAVQNDTGRLLRMIVADTELPEEATAELAVKRSDGSYYNIECELEDGAFECDLTQALTQAGDTECQLKVDGLVSSYMFVVSVQADVSGVSVPQMGVYPQTLLDAADQIMYAQNDVKLALLQLAEKVAYVDADGQQYYDDLYNALYPPVRATSVVLSKSVIQLASVGLTQTITATVFPAESTETVVWGTSDSSVCRVANGIVTSVGEGSCTITATAGMVSASCNVIVSAVQLVGITAVYTQSGVVYNTDDIESLKADLVVTAEFDDSSTVILDDNDYTLSGTLGVGTSTITVTYSEETTTFTVSVTDHIVPANYTKVDYITSAVHGTPSASHLTSTPYIKTGFPATDTDIINYTVTLVFKRLFATIVSCPFGGRNGKTAGATTLGTVFTAEKSGNNSSLNFGNNGGNTLVTYIGNGYPSVNTKTKLEIRSGSIYIDDTLVESTGAATAVQPSSYKWVLFGRNNMGSYSASTTNGGDLSPMIGNIYEFSIKDGNGNYVANYIPCQRNSDSVYGMYDIVGNVFYTSAIGTAFMGGNE